MSSEDVIGVWYLELVGQEPSDQEAEDGYERPPQKAAKTELAGATLELRANGSYRMQGPDAAMSHGTWTTDGSELALAEAADAKEVSGYEGLEYAYHEDDRLVVGLKLNPDAHDGHDVLILTFGRTPPKPKGPKPESYVERLIAVDDQGELDELLDERDGEPADIERALWDAWLEGRFLNDPDSDEYGLHMDIVRHDALRAAGGFTRDHAKHALTNLDYVGERELAVLVFDHIVRLPADEQADADLAPLITGPWLEHFVTSRFTNDGVPEEVYERRLVPQPAFDDACRARALGAFYIRFDPIERLFPPGHPDFAKVVIRYRGRGMLDVPLSHLEARGLADEVLAAALDLIANPGRWWELWLNGIMFSVVLSIRAGKPLPRAVLDELPKKVGSVVMGSLSDDEKAKLRDLIAVLPAEQRKLVSARFWLDPPTTKGRRSRPRP